MKTEAELKKLAEVAVEFIGVVHDDLDASIQGFFYSDIDAPIFAHLAKRKLEELECKWDEWYLSNPKIFGFRIEHPKDVHLMKYYFAENANSYIALWSAIEATGEK